MKKLVLDRFEGIYALLTDSEEKTFAIATTEMPEGAKEGDVVIIKDDGEIYIDTAETENRRKAILEKQKRAFR